MSAGDADRPPLGVDRAFGHWAAGPERPTLGPGELHVWRADLRSVEDALEEALSEPDRRRAAAIGETHRRMLWARSRGLLRALLGRYLQVEPGSFEISNEERGKPSPVTLAGGHRGPYFNISHSAHLALFGFAVDAPLGIDVQFARTTVARPARDHLALARRHLGEAQARALEQSDPSLRERDFVRLWARHEAELKRLGSGLGGGSASGGKPAGAARGGPDQGTRPWVAELDPDPDAAAVVACAHAPRLLRLWDWSAPPSPT